MSKKKDDKPLFESTHEMRDEAGNLLGYVMEPTAEYRAIVEKWLVPFNGGNPPTTVLLGTFAEDDLRHRVSIPTLEELQHDLENGTGPLGNLGRKAVLSEIGLGHGVSFSIAPFVSSSHKALLNSLLTTDCLAGMTVNQPSIHSEKSIEELTDGLREALKSFYAPPDMKFFADQLYSASRIQYPIDEEVMEQRRLSLPHQIPTIKLSAIQDQVDAYCSTHEDDSSYPPAAEGESYTVPDSEPSIFSDKWHIIPADWIRWRFFTKYGYTTSRSTELVTVAAMLEIVKEAEVIRRKLRALRPGMSNVFIKKPAFYVPHTRLISLQWVAWIAVERGMTFEEAYRNSIKD